MAIPVIIFGASKMKPRVDAFREDFVRNYLATGKDYPIKSLLQATSLLPVGINALKLLLQRDSIEIRGYKLSNRTGRVVEARFRPIVEEREFEVALKFPQPFLASAVYTQTELNIAIETRLVVTFVSKPAVQNSELIPDRVALARVIVSEEALSYTFFDSESTSAEPALMIVASFMSAGATRNVASGAMKLAHVDSALSQHGVTGFLISGGSCSGLVGTQYYVLCDKQQGLVVIHDGSVIVGGQIRYKILWGPGTVEQCNQWEAANYPDGLCPTGSSQCRS